MPPIDYVGFTLIIDDIVRPDGTTYMQQLGGGGPQAMFGYKLVSECFGETAKLGLAAGVGADIPAACKAWLTAIGVDVSGLVDGPQSTPRAWQLFEEDGRRTQVWRVLECAELYQQLRPAFEQLPAHFQCAQHYHLGIHAAHPPMKLLKALAAAAHSRNGLLSVETYTCCDSLPPEESVRELLAVVDIFSPNLSEAESIVGPGTPRQVVERLLQLGARLVVLRMGEQGVLVAKQAAAVGGGGEQAVEWHEVPAVPNTQVVDVTGCGNACCGGFLAGLQAGQGLRSSAVWGCVAGSIMAEAQGVPAVDMPRLVSEAHAKQQWLLRHMRGGQREPLVVAACVGVRPSPSPAAATTAAAAGRRWTRGAHCMLPRGSSSCRVVAAGAARLLL